MKHFLLLISIALCYCSNKVPKKCVLAKHSHKDVNVSILTGPGVCFNTTVCKRLYSISLIHYPPYSDLSIIGTHMERCCHCFNYKVTNLKNTSELTLSILKQTDIIAPMVNTDTKPTLFGFHYIPILKAPDYLYITPTPDSYLKRVMVRMSSTFPLGCIVQLLAIIAGFFTWMIESRANSEEFPKPIFIGWFEGTWWSFISMSTVGYGDKTPRTVLGRLFAVVWVLIGITLFNVLTGVCTVAIESSQQTPIAMIKNQRVGVLQFRSLDAMVVAKHGGIIVNTNATSFFVDLIMLVQKLKEGRIDGMVMDLLMYNSFMFTLYPKLKETNFKMFGPLAKMAKQNFAYLLEETVTALKPSPGEQYSYGFAIKDKEVYDYFSDAYKDNFINFDTWINLKMNRGTVSKLRMNQKEEGIYDFGFTDQYLVLISILLGIVFLQFICALSIRWKQKKIRTREIAVAEFPQQT